MNCPWGWVNEEDGDELHHGVDAPQQQEHRGHPVQHLLINQSMMELHHGVDAPQQQEHGGHPVQHLLINQSIKDGVDNKNTLRAPCPVTWINTTKDHQWINYLLYLFQFETRDWLGDKG